MTDVPVSQEEVEVTVTDADKEASAELAHAIGMSCEDFTSGGADVIVQAFARHRQQAERAFEDRERKLREALWTPREAAWSGLARDLMMAFDMGCRTPREIFQHLDRCGKLIPQWLRDEGEMKHLDHVPSKGTRAVIIYRAMLEPAMADLYRTGQLAPVQQPSGDVVEAVARRLFTISSVEALQVARSEGVEAYRDSKWFKLSCAIEDCYPAAITAYEALRAKDTRP